MHSVAFTWHSVSNIRELVLRTFVPLCISESTSCYIRTAACHIRGRADKSLVGPGRKQATATKHGIYSTYSPRSSIHYLARCSNLCKSLKKKFRSLFVQPGLRGSNGLRVGRKMATFQFFVQSREQAVARSGQIRRTGCVIKTLEAQVGKFFLGCKCPVSRDIVVQEQDPLGDLPAAWAFFLLNVLQLHHQRSVILRVDSLALWKIINEKDAVLIPKNRGENFSSGFLHSEFFGGSVSRYAASPLIVALSPSHNEITKFGPWPPIATSHLDCAEIKSKCCSDDWHLWRFWTAFRHFGTHFAESFRMSKSSGMMDPTRSREMPSCSAIDLAKIWRSSKISSWIWSIITVLGHPEWGALQVEKSPHLNWPTQFLMVAYDGACSPNVSVRMAWISFGALLCRKKLDDNSHLYIVEIARIAWHASLQPL